MSSSRAFWIGSLKASGSTIATAMPSASPEMAVFIASDHLPDDRFLRARPLRRRPQQRLRVLDAVLRRHEEGVRRHVVDEDEVVLRRVREVAARPATASTSLLRRLAPAPGEQQPGRSQRAARQKLPAALACSPRARCRRIHAHSSATPVRLAFTHHAFPCQALSYQSVSCQACPCEDSLCARRRS